MQPRQADKLLQLGFLQDGQAQVKDSQAGEAFWEGGGEGKRGREWLGVGHSDFDFFYAALEPLLPALADFPHSFGVFPLAGCKECKDVYR